MSTQNIFNPLLKSGIQKINNELNNYFDATVGTGGDYLEPADAWAAGKYVLKQVGDIIFTQNQIIPSNKLCKLYGNKQLYTITVGTYNLKTNAVDKYFESHTCRYILNDSCADLFLNSTYLNTFSYNDRFDITTLTNESAFISGFYFENPHIFYDTTNGGNGFHVYNQKQLRIVGTLLIEMNKVSYYVFSCGVNDTTHIDKIKIIGASATSLNGILLLQKPTVTTNANTTVIGEIEIDTGVTTYIKMTAAIINKIVKTSGTVNILCNSSNGGEININNAYIDTIVMRAGGIENYSHYINLTNCKFNNALTIQNLNAATPAIWNLNNCKCLSTLIINNDNNNITKNKVTGATTLSAGAEYNIITNNRFDGGFTNSSGVINNEINNNI